MSFGPAAQGCVESWNRPTPFSGTGEDGYPIASGVIEGACHYFVKDRMEGAGMRWELEGAQPRQLGRDWRSLGQFAP